MEICGIVIGGGVEGGMGWRGVEEKVKGRKGDGRGLGWVSLLKA